MSAVQAAAAADVAKKTFYGIEKRWREQRSLRSLGVNIADDNHDAVIAASVARYELESTIEDLLRQNPRFDAAEIYEELKGFGFDPMPSTGTVARALRKVRRNFPAPGVFGQCVVFDSAGLDLVDERGQRLRVCAAIDDGTGLFLGWDISPDSQIMAGYGNAAAHASSGAAARLGFGALADKSGLQSMDFSGGVAAFSCVEEIVLRQPADESRNPLPSWPVGSINLHEKLSRRLGNRIIDLLGERVGGVWMGSGTRAPGFGYRTGRQVRLPVINPVFLQDIAKDIRTYNRQKLSALRSIATAKVPDETLAAIGSSLDALAKAIQPET